MKHIFQIPTSVLFVLLMIFCSNRLVAQQSPSEKKILIDIAHGQKFWNDPSRMAGADSAFVERIKYMTAEFKRNATSLDAEVGYLQTKITGKDLMNCDLLFIHIPSSKFTEEETTAIEKYVQGGGSLFVVAEVDYWATLEQTNVNDFLKPFGIVFKSDNPDGQSSGGYSKPGVVTGKRFSIPYHGARMVEGGTPFTFSNKTDENPFGVYKEVGNGGKIIAMGDGMVSLYMRKWEDVDNYQCSEFMHDVLAWLLK